MPISIDYAPSAASVGYSANIAGLADYSRWLAEYNQRQAQLAQQGALQAASLAQQGQFHQDSLAANLYGQNLGYLGDMQRLQAANQQRQNDQQFQWNVHGAQQAQQQQRDQYLRNWENDAKNTDVQNQFARDQMLVERQEAHDQRLAASQMAQERMQFAQRAIAAGTHYYTDAQKRKMGELSGNITSIQGNDRLTDPEKQQALSGLQQQYNEYLSNPTPHLPGDEEQPIHVRAQQATAMMDQNGKFYPAGTNDPSLGPLVPVTPNRSGVFQVMPGFKAQKDTEAEAFEKFRVAQAGKTRTEVFNGETVHRPLTGEEIHQAWMESQKADALEQQRLANPEQFAAQGQQEQALDQEAKNQYDNYQTLTANIKEQFTRAKSRNQPQIADDLRQRYGLDEHGNMKQFKLADFKANVRQQAAQQQMAQQQAPQQPQQDQQAPPQAQQPPQAAPVQQPPAEQRVAPDAAGTRLVGATSVAGWTKEAIDKRLEQLNPQFRKTADPAVLKHLTPALVAHVAVAAAADPNTPADFDPIIVAAHLAGVQAAHEQAARSEASRGTTIKDLGKSQRAAVEQHYPKPKTKAEFDALPSGMQFVAPDGSIRAKP